MGSPAFLQILANTPSLKSSILQVGGFISSTRLHRDATQHDIKFWLIAVSAKIICFLFLLIIVVEQNKLLVWLIRSITTVLAVYVGLKRRN